VAGSVEFVGVTLFVNNKSQVRPLAIVDPLGFRSVLAPTRRIAVDQRLSVVVEGQVRRHELVVATKALEIIDSWWPARARHSCEGRPLPPVRTGRAPGACLDCSPATWVT